jgi:hypothetical protein
MPKSAFLSHSTKDAAKVDEHRQFLEGRGPTCWIAPRDVIAGTNWRESIGAALDGCDCVVLFISKTANESAEVYKEIQYAAEIKKPIIPVRLEDIQPAERLKVLLGLAHRIDLFRTGWAVQRDLLVAAVQSFIFNRAWRPEATDHATRTSVITAMNHVLAKLRGTQSNNDKKLSGPAIRAWLSERWHHFDSNEKGILIRFLYASGLIVGEPSPVSLQGFDLCEINLRGACLPGVNFAGTDIRNADLRDSNLAGGTLQWAWFGGTKLEGANLRDIVIVGNEIEDAGVDPLALQALGAVIRRPD